VLDMVPVGEASPMWRAIEYSLELLKKEIIYRLGNGESISIWRDNWLPRNSLLKPSNPVWNTRPRRVSGLIDQESRC
jgi:hypothetical protein